MDTKLGGILGAFIFAVIAIALAISLANNQVLVTQTVSVMEQKTLTNGTTTQLTNGIITGITSIVNATNASQSQPSTNYTVVPPQGLYFSGGRSGLFNVTYTYSYVPDATSNTLITLVTLFFVFGIIGGVLYYLSPNFRELIGLGK